MDEGATRRWARARKVTGCLLLLCHLGAVTVANLAETTPLSRALRHYVNPYLRFFGQWQEWDMFTTIPLYQSIQGKVVAKAVDGAETRYDPMLPGFTEQPDSLRMASMFARLVWARKGFRWHVERYHAAVCRAIAQRTGSTPKSVRVELDTLTIRNLRSVRHDGVIGEPRTFKSEDVPCPR
jgi:hypothetical protein